MSQLNQVVVQLDPDARLTVTVQVHDARGRRGGIERRREEVIAAYIWMAVHAPAEPAAADE